MFFERIDETNNFGSKATRIVHVNNSGDSKIKIRTLALSPQLEEILLVSTDNLQLYQISMN
jgi:hypothetical protein